MRTDRDFMSGGIRCAAWHYTAAETGAVRPCVVMGHAFGLTRDSGLESYAEQFAAAGYNVLVFDFRHLGASDGHPRQIVSPKRQLDDLRAAVAHARTLPGVDPERIVLWGMSLSGGQVIELAAEDARIAAVISVVGSVDMVATSLKGLRRDGPVPTTRLSVALAQHALYSSIHHKLGANPGMELDDIRRLLDELQTLASEPTDVTYEEVDAGGVPAILATPGRAAADRMIVHTHGGGMVANSAHTHRKLAAHLAKAAGARALVVDYRRAPEHQFPAQIEDTVTALRWLRGQGIAPEHTATAGDSAGANLAITAVLKLRDLGEPLPAAVIAFSPWIDMEHVGETFTTNAHTDVLLSREASELSAGFYLGETSRTHPLANPLHADLQGFPPVFVTAGSVEVLLDSAERFVDRARAAGVDTTYECAPDQQHVHTLMAGRSPEADATIAHVGRWLRPLLGLDERGQ